MSEGNVQEPGSEALVDRRTVLKAGALAGVAAFLAACGTSGTSTAPTDSGGAGQSVSPTLNVANWTLYIDLSSDSSARPTVVDFEKRYGAIGKGFIHVHHLRELAEVGKSVVVDPVKDLRPVCPNCHAMLHRQRPALSIAALKRRLR